MVLTAQFHTIERNKPSESTDIYNLGIAIESEDDFPPLDSISRQPAIPDTTSISLSLEQRRQLYLQLVYFDNEINEQIMALFRMQIAQEADKLKSRYQQQAYSFEDECVTTVHGHYGQSDELTIESVLAEILKNNLAHPRVVLAQAVLETGWFKSSVCLNYNNLFGLTNPRTKDYYRFKTWQESVRAYYTKVQYRYKGGNYLHWLREIGYAEDPDYTVKLRVLLDGPLQSFAP